ncbi:MAG TPA: helix-turn-helix domain-containing protein [Polyangia bacterium]|nr:helix-turn-helix domain-containing protein [Polyangia bacterium]
MDSDALYQPFPLPTRARGHIWRHRPETRRPRHFHAEPELNLITAGSARFGMGDLAIDVGAGDLLWWPPGQDHVLLDASPDFDLFVVGVTPELSDRVLGGGGAVAHAAPARVRLPRDVLGGLQSICAASPHHRDPAGEDPTVIERRVGDLWREAHQARGVTGNRHVLTRRALARLLVRPDITRAEIAEAIGADPTEVSRHFHRDMGLTLAGYRTRLRLLRFVEGVDGGAPSLMAAAMDAGFGSYAQCHRAFAQTFGCAPRQFFATDLRDQMAQAFSP